MGWKRGGGSDEGSEGGGRIEGLGGGGGSVVGWGGGGGRDDGIGNKGGGKVEEQGGGSVGGQRGGALGGRPDDKKELSGGGGCWEAEVMSVVEEVAREFNLVEISVRDRRIVASSSLTNTDCCERSSTDLEREQIMLLIWDRLDWRDTTWLWRSRAQKGQTKGNVEAMERERPMHFV